MTPAIRRRAPRGIVLTFPAGFVELTTRREPRHSYWEQEIAACYPELDRATRSKLLSLLESPDMMARLDGLVEDVRVAVGLVLDGRDTKGAVLLSVTAVRSPDGWSSSNLTKGLAAATTSRPATRLRELPCAKASVMLVDHGQRRDIQHTDLFLADHALDAVVLISAFCLASAPVDLLPTLTEMVNSYEAL